MRKLFVGDQVYLVGFSNPYSVVGFRNGRIILSGGLDLKEADTRDLRLATKVPDQALAVSLTEKMVRMWLPFYIHHPKDVFSLDLHSNHLEQLKDAAVSASGIPAPVPMIADGTEVTVLVGGLQGSKGKVIAFDPRDQTYGVTLPSFLGWWAADCLAHPN